MLFLFRPFRRFPVQCAMTYMAGPCIDVPSTAGGHERG